MKAEAGEQPDGDLRQLEFKKNQYGPRGQNIVVRYQNGLFLPERGTVEPRRGRTRSRGRPRVHRSAEAGFADTGAQCEPKPGVAELRAEGLCLMEAEAKKANLAQG